MDIEALAEEVWKEEGLENDSIYKHIFFLAFKKGFQHGLARPQSKINNISVFKKDLIDNRSLQELACMQCRIDRESYSKLMNDFIVNQTILNKIYADQFEVNNHFLNWIRQNAKKLKTNMPNNSGRL